MANQIPKIADFRSFVMFYQEQQTTNAFSSEIFVNKTEPVSCRANVVSTKPASVVNGVQADIDIKNVTHYAECYAIPAINIFDCMERRVRQSDGTSLRQIFRVLGSMFLDTQCRYMRIDLQLYSQVVVAC